MGNQLVGAAPAQIFTVDQLLSEVPDLEFDKKLGDTRFLKVARAYHENILVVVKLFTIQDLGILLGKERERIEEIRKVLQNCVNCLPFYKVFCTPKSGFLVRQYVKDSLCDRISNRPFLTLIEKKWIAFQLLLALQQAHKHGICHGDIKTENVMITSWNWVILTDFASFKPTFLPEDNPAEFNYFFDTSRRRTCYIAPERFKKEEIEQNDELLDSMDIFSAGCVLIELFTDLTPFNFSQLLYYRDEKYEPSKILDKIEDENIKKMLTVMIQKDPEQRKSANEHLCDQKGGVFPDYFYTFLHCFMQSFSTDPLMTSDHKINKIHENLDVLLTEISVDGLTLILNLVTAHLRSLKFCGAKVKATQILTQIAQKVKSEVILDRILPFLITLLDPKENFASVRISAFNCIMDCVKSVEFVPFSDANIFKDYILPHLLHLCRDKNDLVRANVASRIAEIAQESVRFLDLLMKSAPTENYENYELELVALHGMISDAVSCLLATNSNTVKMALMEFSVTKLTIFFGKQKAEDVILNHMLTFLNDKKDAQLRLSFYDNIVGVAVGVGWQCSNILLPLLQQGLSDPEEFVIARCINTMARLTKVQLLKKVDLYELLKDTTPYLLHPNLWIRQSTATFVSATAQVLDGVDVVVKLGTILAPFMKHPVIQMELPVLILANVEAPIPRSILDAIIKAPNLTEFLNYLEERQTARNMSKTNLMYSEIPPNLKPLFRRLASDGMTSGIEDKLLFMKENLLKISKQRAMKSQNDFEGVDLSHWQKAKRNKKLVNLEFADNKFDIATEANPPDEKKEELKRAISPNPAVKEHSNVMQNENLPFRPEISPSQSSAPCKLELEDTIKKKKDEYEISTLKRRNIERGLMERNYPNSNWKPKGNLIANLHEHKGGINKLVRIAEKPLFASASSDGLVKLWDCNKFEGLSYINKPLKVYDNHSGSSVNGLASSADGQLLISGCENGTICTYGLDRSDPIVTINVQVDDFGPPVDFCFRETGSSPLIVYITAFGKIIGIDSRSPQNQPAFKFENDLLEGLQTSMALSPDQSWLVNGTSSGVITCWDLRFQLPIVKCTHPAESRIRQLNIPGSGEVLASVQGNNEVGLWNMESQFRQLVLWASTSPLLSTNQSNSQSVTAMQSIQNNVLITAGTDMRLRYWDLANPEQSFIIAGATSEKISSSTVSYKTKLVDGTEVVQEVQAKPKTSFTSTGQGPGFFANIDELHGNKPGLEGPTVGHVDWISALTLCQTSKWYIVTGSRDGYIKVWK